MCDTAVVVERDRVLFAKNSDRDPNEAQLLEWRPRAEHPRGATLRCTWIEIPQASITHAVLISRPFWMWGAEMGANEHGVVIGNQAVFTREPHGAPGLTGMDLLRLALERASSAEDAVSLLTALLERHGQGGGCGHENRSFTYHNSFGVADSSGAFVLETAGRHWEVERIRDARTLSNALTVEAFARRHGDPIRTRAARAAERRQRSGALARQARSPADMMALLRDHGPHQGPPRYSRWTGALGAPCVHAGGILASSQTTGSWVSELGPEGARHWVTGTAAPCTGLFKPVRVDEPLDLGPAPTDRADTESLWWRHERLHRRVDRDPARQLPLYASERDALEASWLAEPPEPAAAFAEADRRLVDWEGQLAAATGPDARPRTVRRYWRTRDQHAGLVLAGAPLAA